jgi:hypothetical protein
MATATPSNLLYLQREFTNNDPPDNNVEPEPADK